MTTRQNIPPKVKVDSTPLITKNPGTFRVVAFQLAESIDVRELKRDFLARLLYSNTQELYYQVDVEQYVSFFAYGAVCFYNVDEEKIVELKALAKKYSRGAMDQIIREKFQVHTHGKKLEFGFNKVTILNPDKEIIRIILLNVAQSTALTHYFNLTKSLLEETDKHSGILESKGRLDISGTRLQKFIGRALNLKNTIVKNLYILDAPPGILFDENMKIVDSGMKKNLSMQNRSGIIHEELRIVKEHLSLFSDMMHHRTSILLEWIIAALVFVEVVDLIISKVF
jgi:uncharacterized Rmd1/YagE family protein